MSRTTKLVPECNLEAMEVAIATLNKRCKRLGLHEITMISKVDHIKARVNVLTHDGHINKVWMLPEKIAESNSKWPHTDTGVRMAWYEVTVTGETPRLNGWEFMSA